MTALTLTFLGSFQAALDSEQITRFRSDKARALLAYLAVEAERPHSRASLCGLFWPDQDDDAALHNLSQTLLRLREALGDTRTSAAFLRISRQAIQWNTASDYRLDTADFARLASSTDVNNLEQAAALYHGELLPGFSMAGCPAFGEWLLLTREHFAQLALTALGTLTRARLAGGRYVEAAQHARRQLALDPWREAAHRQLMRALAGTGDRAAALAAYTRCRQILHDELGVEPDDETRALYEQIRTNELNAEQPTAQEVGRPQDTQPQRRVLASPALLAATPPTAAPLHNLPDQATSFVGREAELAELVALLQKPEVRLVTLVGVGGMGKTRLAQELGRVSITAFADGVFFVPLAPISTPAALVGAIATALGIALQGRDPHNFLFQMLCQKQLLLILDNFEQLLGERTDAVDLVAELLGAAPEVRLLVTSRERLKLRGEHVYAVQALTFSTTATLEEAAAATAVRLFVQSVQRVQAGFQLTPTNLAAVLSICNLVQGMPLGLELAAANAGGLPLSAIAEAIEQSAAFLAVDWRDVPERQRSMRAVFDWSWQLLRAEERRILRQSAVFRGGFAYPAVQAVIGATPALLARLTDTSLLQWQAMANGEGRYSVHELLRQFAAEELNLANERALVEERHARYYLAYLAARGRRLGRGEPKEASSEIQTELDNVRLAWQWAVAHGLLAEIEQASYAWWQFCQFQGLEIEGRLNFAVAVDGVRRQLAQPEVDEAIILLGQPLLAKLLAIHANYLFAQGRNAEMAAEAREAVALGAACGGVEGETFGTFVLGRALQDLEYKREAGEMWQRTIQLIRLYQGAHPESELLHDAHWMAHSFLCGSALHFGDHTGSRSHIVQALQICQSLGKRWGELYCLASLAGIDFFLYDFAAAEAGFAAALPLAHTLNYRRMEMVAQERLSGVLRLRGDYMRAHTLLEQAVELAGELGYPYDEALFLAALIRLHCQLGDQATAAQRHEQLTQLLARVKLPKECQLYAYLAAAIKAQYAGAAQEALRYAEQAEQVNQQGGDILFRLVDTALILGHARAAVGQLEAATPAFQQALDAFEQFGNQALAAEPRAGLAQIALAQGDLAEAQAQVEAILPVLAQQPHAGYNNPFFIYLTCYRILAANGDSRAGTVLQHGYDLLQQDAAALDDISRACFLSAVPVHRDLLTAYAEMQAEADKASGGQGDKETKR